MAADGPHRPRHKIVSIVGTRPEAIKMAPLVRALHSLADQQVVLTGQHAGLAERFRETDATLHELQINLREQTAGEILDLLHHALIRRFVADRPDFVLVQGDTTSALAGALAAFDCGIPVGHVEAGLRSGDLQQPWPEEGNRIQIDEIATLLFAPTADAAGNLAREPLARGAVHVTGNTGIDALIHARSFCRTPARTLAKTLLVTCHRRENSGQGLEELARALDRITGQLPLEAVFVLHSNPHLHHTVERLLGGKAGIILVEPLDYEEMVCRMDSCWLILSDSGGIQEEAPALGKPVFVLRNVTERPEAIATDNIRLIGTDPDRLFAAVQRLLADEEDYARMSQPSFPFGDGHAAPRIAAHVLAHLNARTARACAASLNP